MTPAERYFWPKVDRSAGPDGCWPWLAGRQTNGYGHIGRRTGVTASGTQLAHRAAYELLVGAIPEGMHLDHLCRNTGCVNPAHLEPVTAAENTRRGLHGILHTHCGAGHELTGDNLYVKPSDGSKKCRECARQKAKERRASGPKRVHWNQIQIRVACGALAGTAAGVVAHKAAPEPMCSACRRFARAQANREYRARQGAAA